MLRAPSVIPYSLAKGSRTRNKGSRTRGKKVDYDDDYDVISYNSRDNY